MKIKCISVLLIALMSTGLNVSAQSWLWAEQGSSSLKADLAARNIATNRTGNVYHTGTFSTSITFGTNTLRTQYGDVYLVKYDQNGNVLWAKQSQSPNSFSSLGYSVATDDSDNSYITGLTGDQTVFGITTLNNACELFLVKYDPSGNVLWAKQPSISIAGDTGFAVTTDIFGHEYVTGAGACLIKFDRNGNTDWSVTPTVNNLYNNTLGYSVSTDGYGNIYISGQFQDALTFGTYNLYSANPGVFIAKFDSNGKVLWAQQSTNTPANPPPFLAGHGGYSVAADRSGAAYLTGAFPSVITFGSYTFNSVVGISDNFFVVKYNPGGTIAWGKEATQINESSWGSYSVCTDDSSHVYISGAEGAFSPAAFVFSNDTITVTHTNGYLTAPSFLLKLDSSGNVLCSSTIDGGGTDPNTVVSDSSGKFVYLGGGFLYTFGIGKDSLSANAGSYDPYVGRWQSCKECDLAIRVSPPQTTCSGQSVVLTVSGGTNYTWSPTTGLNVTTGDTVVATITVTTVYSVTGTDSSGCTVSGLDTIIVKQGVNKPIITDTSNILTSSATEGNQWYLNGVVINGATNKTYRVDTTGCYSVTATNIANGCNTTSDTLCITTLSGINQLSVANNQFSIYPNPTSGNFVIQTTSTAKQLLQVSDITGKLLLSQTITNPKTTIDATSLADGIYIVSLKSDDVIINEKLVVVK